VDIALFGGPAAAALAEALRPLLAPTAHLACDPHPTPCPDPPLALLLGGPGDAAWRGPLAQAGWSYQVLYGGLDAALRAVHAALPQALRAPPAPRSMSHPQRLRAWACEKCSDPECEHRLFTALQISNKNSL
jgi:hypothetical protein